jgi:hypothetical protein
MAQESTSCRIYSVEPEPFARGGDGSFLAREGRSVRFPAHIRDVRMA